MMKKQKINISINPTFLFADGIGKNKWISYDMKDIDLEQVTRLEFVVKMPKMKERNTSISLYVDADTGFTFILFFFKWMLIFSCRFFILYSEIKELQTLMQF